MPSTALGQVTLCPEKLKTTIWGLFEPCVICIPVYLSMYLSACIPVCLFVCLLVYLLLYDRLVGLVVKASASTAEDPGFESRLRRDFFRG